VNPFVTFLRLLRHAIICARAPLLHVLRSGPASPAPSRPLTTGGITCRPWCRRQRQSSLHQIVARHHGDFEDLRTESRSGFGRALAAALAVPPEEFDATLSELQTLGRIESISQAGEDSAVRIATAARRLAAAQTTLSRLQRLQSERKGELRDAVALEKDIAQAEEAVVEADRLHENLLSTAALAHIHFTLFEDFRATLRISAAGTFLEIRNSLVAGISAVLSTVALVLSALFGYGLPCAFWLALLLWPLRALWRRFHHAPQAAVGS